MLRLFWRKIFFVIKYFQRNHFSEKSNFSENIFRRLSRTKNKILSLADRILATFTGFQLLLLDSSDEGRNPVAMARFWTVSPKSGPTDPDSDRIGQIPASFAGIRPTQIPPKIPAKLAGFWPIYAII
jgi:hypothetical protein